MATKRLSKEAKPVLKALQPKKVAAKTGVAAKKTSKSPLKQSKQRSGKQESLVKTGKSGAVSEKASKTTTGKSVKIKIAKPVNKKLTTHVKKTPIAKTTESKEVVTSKKEASAEKKTKADVPVEKELKTPKASTKTAKAENNVVIPKTSTDKKVDYEPDFMKSVLDTPATAPATATMRYSDAELQEFRDLIGKKLDAAKKELAYLQGLITRRDEMGGDETDNRYMTMEDGGMSMEREQLSQMASRQITFIDHLEKALMRIESKTYGICRVTGKLIDKARLRAVPHATLSMEAKLGITK